MQMCAQELAICAINNIPVKVVIINNQVLGMVRQWQELIYENRYSHIDLGGQPGFCETWRKLMASKDLRATNKEEARLAWQEALEYIRDRSLSSSLFARTRTYIRWLRKASQLIKC